MTNFSSNNFQISNDETLSNIVMGVSCDWLYETICRAGDVREAIRNVVNPIDDEICSTCFLMNLALTYDSPDYTPIRPGQVLMIDTGKRPPFLGQLFVVDSLTGAISINPEYVYEKGFMAQEADIDQDGEVYITNQDHAYVVGYPDRNRDEFEMIDMITGERIPASIFMLVPGLDLAEDVKTTIYHGNKKILDSVVARIPDQVISIFAELQLYKPFVQDVDGGLSNDKYVRNSVQGKIHDLKEELELWMVSMAQYDYLEKWK